MRRKNDYSLQILGSASSMEQPPPAKAKQKLHINSNFFLSLKGHLQSKYSLVQLDRNLFGASCGCLSFHYLSQKYSYLFADCTVFN
jgi:hypothetical protein